MNDTIAAQATARGNGGVGIIRVSGSAAREVAKAVLNVLPKPRIAEYLPFYDADGSTLDQGIALFFRILTPLLAKMCSSCKDMRGSDSGLTIKTHS